MTPAARQGSRGEEAGVPGAQASPAASLRLPGPAFGAQVDTKPLTHGPSVAERKRNPHLCGGFSEADARTRTGDPFITRTARAGASRRNAASKARFRLRDRVCFPNRAGVYLTQT